MALDAVSEASSQHSHQHARSLSRAIGAVAGSFNRQKSRRRLSSFSSTSSATRRRGSIQSFIDSLPSSTAARKPSSDQQRFPLQHQDSGIPSFPMHPQTVSRQAFSFKRLSTIRRRATATGPAGEALKPTVFVPPMFQSPAQPAPGAAARQAAAAATRTARTSCVVSRRTRNASSMA